MLALAPSPAPVEQRVANPLASPKEPPDEGVLCSRSARNSMDNEMDGRDEYVPLSRVTTCPVAASAIALFEDHGALVKTVKNNEWLPLLGRLKSKQEFRTSFSLPPRGGHGMALFGRVSAGCA
eukprot:6233325-Prymnesium_polylepis.1